MYAESRAFRWVCSVSPPSSTDTSLSLDQNWMLSKPVWATSPRKKSVSEPSSSDGCRCESLKRPPKPPKAPCGLRERIRVAGLGEEELAEVRAGTEDAVLRALERRALALRQLVGIERILAVRRGVVDRHPLRLEHLAIGM